GVQRDRRAGSAANGPFEYRANDACVISRIPAGQMLRVETTPAVVRRIDAQWSHLALYDLDTGRDTQRTHLVQAGLAMNDDCVDVAQLVKCARDQLNQSWIGNADDLALRACRIREWAEHVHDGRHGEFATDGPDMPH